MSLKLKCVYFEIHSNSSSLLPLKLSGIILWALQSDKVKKYPHSSWLNNDTERHLNNEIFINTFKNLSFIFETSKLIQCIVMRLNESHDKSFKTVSGDPGVN